MRRVIDQKSATSFEITDVHRRPADLRRSIIFIALLVRKAYNRVALLVPSLLLVALAAAPTHLALSTDVRHIVTSILVVADSTAHPATSHSADIIALTSPQCATQRINLGLPMLPPLFPFLFLL